MRLVRDCAPMRSSHCARAACARGRAKVHMSLLPVIDPSAIKQHRIAVNYENNFRHVSAALAFAFGVKALARRPDKRFSCVDSPCTQVEIGA